MIPHSNSLVMPTILALDCDLDWDGVIWDGRNSPGIHSSQSSNSLTITTPIFTRLRRLDRMPSAHHWHPV